MPSHESEMTSKDVKSLALRHGVPLDLHPVALRKGWTMNKLPDDMIGLYEQYFEFSGIRVPFSTFLLAVIKHFRVHISQLMALGLNRLTMFELYCPEFRQYPIRDLFGFFTRLVTGTWFSFKRGWARVRRLLFFGGLATTWDFPGFRPVFKDTERNVVTMSVFLRFLFISGASISKGPPLTSQDQMEQHTTRPLPSDQPIPEKTDHQKRVEVEDPKIVAIREREAKAASKEKEKETWQ
ncbi:hypothetical protein Tco_0984948 [Tanacetum coccineum]